MKHLILQKVLKVYRMDNILISFNIEAILESIRQAIREEIGKQARNVVVQSAPAQPEYYERSQLCDLAHISPTTLWRMEKDGLIKKVKFGRRNLYLKTDVDELLSSGKLSKYSNHKK